MARHRALLIGCGDYEMRGVSPLPFIPGDLARLGAALEARGFDEVLVLAGREGGRQVSANYLNARVIGFLRRARPDDTLLILLSGHGVHAAGRDYLVPEDIDEDTHPFVSGCVPIDWREHLDETPAGHVIFLIDACREGIEQDSMGVAAVTQWSRQKVSAALRRKVAYVYACSPGQYALFVRPQDSVADPAADPVPGVRPGDSYSIFSRSVSDVITTHGAATALTLGGFQDAVQDRMTELHRAYRKNGRPQTLRVITDIPSDGFFFLPPPPRPRSPGRNERPERPTRSTARAVADATVVESAAMSIGAGTSRPTHSPRGIRLSRRGFSALALLCVLGVAAWAAATFNGNGSGDGNGGDKGGGAASGKSGSRTSLSPSPSGAKPSSTSSKEASGSTLPNCVSSAAELTLRSLQNSYGPDDTPFLLLTAKNSSDSDCKVDLGPKNAVVTVTQASGDDYYWSSSDCPKSSAGQVFRVPAHGTATYTTKWDRRPSAPQCRTPSAGLAGAGTYLAEVATPGFGKAQTSFVLKTQN